jgi:hypothetical protein
MKKEFQRTGNVRKNRNNEPRIDAEEQISEPRSRP